MIAVDFGAVNARRWGWPIHLLIGDLDSLPSSELSYLEVAGIPMVTAPPVKDETDLELGLAKALEEGARVIVICGALGGRPDHMLANLLLLTRDDLAGLDVVIADGTQTIRLLRGAPAAQGHAPPGLPVTLLGSPGDLLSLLPAGEDAVGITTEGLLYGLRDETLHLGQARGVSNVFVGAAARIWLRSGLLYAIHIEQSGGVNGGDLWIGESY